MNKKQKILNRQNTLNNIKRESLNATRIGCAKYWKGTTYKHWRVMSDIVWKLSNEGYEVITEVEFINGGRGDILCIDLNGDGFIIEVLHTESEERYNLKLDKYPFPVFKVHTKDFDINKWDF